MDEILIEEKKYVSSKQAAKITGYAKDYIGQLCREGRVPARLVGRSWYVLESAIRDHRFGDTPAEAGPVAMPEPYTPPVSEEVARAAERRMPDVVGVPRYRAEEHEPLPTLNRLRTLASTPAPEGEDVRGTEEDETDTAADTEEPQVAPAEPVFSEPLYPEKDAVPSEELAIPIHIRPEPVEPSRETVMREAEPEKASRAPRQAEAAAGRVPMRVMKTAGFVVAAAAVSLALIGSGYFDTSLVSNKRAQVISGILLYEK